MEVLTELVWGNYEFLKASPEISEIKVQKCEVDNALFLALWFKVSISSRTPRQTAWRLFPIFNDEVSVEMILETHAKLTSVCVLPLGCVFRSYFL